MPYLSELIGKLVTDANGERLGRVNDVIAHTGHSTAHPVISALVIGGPRKGTIIVPVEAVAALLAPVIPLQMTAKDLRPHTPSEHDLYLVRDVLDKQIIDTDGVRVVRVNDLDLQRTNGHFYVANVDVGTLGLMRRLGLGKASARVASRLRKGQTGGTIPWHAVELLPGDQPLRLKVSSDRMADLHPADLAEIMSDLSRAEGSKLLDTLDIETAANMLEEVEPDFQAQLVQDMSDERVADLLEEMAPDEAADLLAELPEERSEDLLALMEADEAQDVRKLLAYPEDSVGGLMTTEFIAVPEQMTADQTIAYLRRTADEAETIYYVYVTDDQDRLQGVFSLQDLVLADPGTPVSEFMHRRVVTLAPTATQDEAAQAVAKYNLLAIPVVDESGRLHGIVTADDALDKIIPTAWKKRLPRMFR